MSELLQVSSNPHVRAKDTTSSIMLDVIIAMLPATLFGIYNFGIRAAILILVCIIACVASEGIYEHFMHKTLTIKDLSAVVTGILLALNLPVQLPIWMAIIGSVFAIIIVKQLYGVSGATPLAVLKNGGSPDLMDLFIGQTAGTIGETSAIALIIGGVYLIIRKVISYQIPVFYIGTVAVFTAIYAAVTGQDILYFVGAHIFGGGLLLGAFFMATDYVTSPITPNGKIVFGIILGLLTSIFRLFGPSAEGVSYAIIFSNLLVPLIERVTWPRAFGVPKGGNK